MTLHYRPKLVLSRGIEKILATARKDPQITEETYQLLEAYVSLAYQRGYDHGRRNNRVRV